MITYKIHLIRHGLTDGNRRGLYAGRTDLPLCDEGREKLRLYREVCGYPAAQKVYTGPLSRCRETARILYPDAWAEALPGLTECDFGAFDGRAIGELKKDPAFNAWVDAGMKTPPPGGESGAELEARVCEALDLIWNDMMARRLTSVAVVTHGGVITTLMAKYGYPRRERAFDWMVPNGAGYTVQMTPQMWMRDEGFEVYEGLPYRFEALRRLGLKEYLARLEEWNASGGGFPGGEDGREYGDGEEA